MIDHALLIYYLFVSFISSFTLYNAYFDVQSSKSIKYEQNYDYNYMNTKEIEYFSKVLL
jgi:hypothetical protein